MNRAKFTLTKDSLPNHGSMNFGALVVATGVLMVFALIFGFSFFSKRGLRIQLVGQPQVAGLNVLSPTSDYQPNAAVPVPSVISSPRADWKIYNNGRYFYSYPPSWKLLNYSPGPTTYSIVVCNTCSSGERNNLDQFVVLQSSLTSVDDFVRNMGNNFEYVRLVFHGLEAVELAEPGSQSVGGSSLTIFVIYKGRAYTLRQRFPSLYNVKHLEQFPAPKPDILSTFGFLDASL